MPSHIELAVRMLNDAAGFFNSLGEQNPQVKDQMAENANMYMHVAHLLEQDPQGSLPDTNEGLPPSEA